MAEYQLTEKTSVIRTADHAYIPDDPANYDRQQYDKWLAAGGVPDPYVPPVPPEPVPQPETVVLLDHENRLRTIEGEPPLVMAEFVARMKKKK